jgi:hypothetical protein
MEEKIMDIINAKIDKHIKFVNDSVFSFIVDRKEHLRAEDISRKMGMTLTDFYRQAIIQGLRDGLKSKDDSYLKPYPYSLKIKTHLLEDLKNDSEILEINQSSWMRCALKQHLTMYDYFLS